MMMMMMLLLMLSRIDSCVWSRVPMIVLVKRSIDIGRVAVGHASGINCMMISITNIPYTYTSGMIIILIDMMEGGIRAFTVVMWRA